MEAGHNNYNGFVYTHSAYYKKNIFMKKVVFVSKVSDLFEIEWP